MPEIIQPRIIVTPPEVTASDYVNMARRAFPLTQQLLSGSPLSAPVGVDACWYGSSVSPETGAFGSVQTGAGLDDWVGGVLQVVYGGRTVYVYVVGFADLTAPLGLARRAFMGLARPSLDSINCQVVAVG